MPSQNIKTPIYIPLLFGLKYLSIRRIRATVFLLSIKFACKAVNILLYNSQSLPSFTSVVTRKNETYRANFRHYETVSLGNYLARKFCFEQGKLIHNALDTTVRK
jgi:hypothetical protein